MWPDRNPSLKRHVITFHYFGILLGDMRTYITHDSSTSGNLVESVTHQAPSQEFGKMDERYHSGFKEPQPWEHSTPLTGRSKSCPAHDSSHPSSCAGTTSPHGRCSPFLRTNQTGDSPPAPMFPFSPRCEACSTHPVTSGRVSTARFWVILLALVYWKLYKVRRKQHQFLIFRWNCLALSPQNVSCQAC